MKTRLNLFVGQLIATISLLILVSLGVFVSFYYSNNHVLSNYNDLINEEKELNKLNQADMLISLARQAEKSFYVEQTIEDAQWVLSNLDKSIAVLQQLYKNETQSDDNSVEQIKFSLNIKKITQQVIIYQQLFTQSLNLWKTRGLTRDSGIGLQLRESAYKGLRSRLDLYNTQGLLEAIYNLRWLEYEHYLYNGHYLAKMKQVIKDFEKQLVNAKLDPPLTDNINLQITNYKHELDKVVTSDEKKARHQRLEKKAHDLLQLLSEHSINDFSLLYRTLLYYEMEYRELGHQSKHVQGVLTTIENLQQAVDDSIISQEEKKQLQLTLTDYASAFNKLVEIDLKISELKNKIDAVFLQITPLVKSAMVYEMQVMQDIQQRTSKENKTSTSINIFISLLMLLLTISIIYWMVRRMGGKVGQIGRNLKQISNGDLKIISHIPAENKRDELDWISYHISIVAKNLSASMESLKKRNSELEIISNKLSKYLAPQIYNSIFSGEKSVNIQSQRKRLTIFFSDIVGFTHTTDTMESEELTNLLNDYLNEMSKIALKYGGTIDKFIGDAIMIFFGDPQSRGDKEDCFACVSMALAMRTRLKELQHIWEQEKGFSQPFKIRIGIATGYCTVGNFGSEERMDYTIIGGNVNLASRLEQQAQADQILIAHETYVLIKDKIDCTAKEEIQVKGISQAVRSYQVNNLLTERNQPAQLQIQVKGKGYNIAIDSALMDQNQRKHLANNLLSLVKKLD